MPALGHVIRAAERAADQVVALRKLDGTGQRVRALTTAAAVLSPAIARAGVDVQRVLDSTVMARDLAALTGLRALPDSARIASALVRGGGINSPAWISSMARGFERASSQVLPAVPISSRAWSENGVG